MLLGAWPSVYSPFSGLPVPCGCLLTTASSRISTSGGSILTICISLLGHKAGEQSGTQRGGTGPIDVRHSHVLLRPVVWESIFPACHGSVSSFVPRAPRGHSLLGARGPALCQLGGSPLAWLFLGTDGCLSGASDDTLLCFPAQKTARMVGFLEFLGPF